MKKFVVLAQICILSGFMTIACQRDRGVYAGNESDTYQPRPATLPLQDVKGELIRVDMAAKTIAVRIENGMEQTFKFDDNTVLKGLDAPIRNLAGKEGSELTVKWRNDNDAKMATGIEVTQVSTSKTTRRPAKKR